jgi:hypothetical protein
MLDILASIRRGDMVGIRETERLHKNGRIVPVAVTVSPIKNADGEVIGASTIARDITRQKQAEYEHEQTMQNLLVAAKHVRTLSGLLPICASCKRIRDDKGYWQEVETYIVKNSEAIPTHGICPECAAEYESQLEVAHK